MASAPQRIPLRRPPSPGGTASMSRRSCPLPSRFRAMTIFGRSSRESTPRFSPR